MTEGNQAGSETFANQDTDADETEIEQELAGTDGEAPVEGSEGDDTDDDSGDEDDE